MQADLLDLLFEGRNRDYGAYRLRRNYHRQLLLAVAISLTAVFSLLLLFRPTFGKSTGAAPPEAVLIRDFRLPDPAPKPPEPPKPPAAATPVRQQAFTSQIAIVEKDLTQPVPPVNALEDVAISSQTTAGTAAGTLQPSLAPEVRGSTAAPSAEPEAKKEIVPDRQPQFPGGMQAWSAFLSKNLKAPEELETGEKRTVLIRFHVAEDGGVTGFTVVQSAGRMFDNEVIRVLKKMPKWTPALQAGRPVPVSFTQPVTFVGVVE